MLKSTINQTLCKIKSTHYPYVRVKSSSKRYNAVIGIGGNLGDVLRRFEKLFFYLEKDKFIDTIRCSSILENPPFGYLDQKNFLNAVIEIRTNLNPHALLKYLLKIELKFLRKRSFKDAPRTLDLDMIFYEDKKINSLNLTLPHPHWANRVSVTYPLKELEII